MVLLAYNPESMRYRFDEEHPLRPERFSLAVDLMDAWGLLAEKNVPAPGAAASDAPRAVWISPPMATEEDLFLVHSSAYVANVQAASAYSATMAEMGVARGFPIYHGMGIGIGDTPPFDGMHEAALLTVGGTIAAVEAVLDGSHDRALAPAGGLHHAHPERAAGFCIYNDCAVAIARAIRDRPGLRVAYLDIDAHHGDGVEAAFAERDDVLTVSVHESGHHLFPGTGGTNDIGIGAGRGFALNLPLPMLADSSCFVLAIDEVVEPALRRFAPDLIVIQGGVDSHREDPLTHLYQSVAGYVSILRKLLSLADELTDGRLVLTGGGGYRTYSEAPRMWAAAMAVLLGREVPETLPDKWLEKARAAAGPSAEGAPTNPETLHERLPELSEGKQAEVLATTREAIRRTRKASPLLGA